MPKKTKSVRRRQRKTRRRRNVKKGGSADTFPLLPNDAAIRVSNPESSDNILAFKS
jgi:hypothetical protein